MITVRLPWPNKILNPNTHLHPREKSDQVTKHRLVARAAVNAQELPPVNWKRIAVTAEFFPPDDRKRDLDNMFAMCKPYLDGIFDALKLNDTTVKRATLLIMDQVKQGEVIIILNSLED